MPDFFRDLADPNLPFLRYTMIIGLLSGIAFGVVGSYVVARRITYIAGAIAHCILGGVGLALFLRNVNGWDWLPLDVGRMGAAVVAAIVIGLVTLFSNQREDTVIGAVWVIGMGSGLLLLHKTPGVFDLESELFGNILLVTGGQVWAVLFLDGVILTVAIYFHKELLLICFDEEFARARGLRVERYYMLLLILTALTIVLLVRVVGVIMVIALLTLPAAIAGFFTRRLWQMMVVASVLCMLFVSGGVTISYTSDLPTGPVIVLFAGAVYLGLSAVQWLRHFRSASTKEKAPS